MKSRTFRMPSIILIYLTIALTLAGCSSIFNDIEEKQAVESEPLMQSESNLPANTLASISNYPQHLQEWQTLKPSIERLVAIEGELKMMLEQLSDIIDNQNSTVETGSLISSVVSESQQETSFDNTEQNAVIGAKQPQETSQNTKIDKIQKTSSKNYAIQLFSLKDKYGLQSNLDALINKHPDILETLPPIIEEIRVNSTKYYRMKVGNYDNQKDANKACARLQSLQTPCMVVNAGGVKFEYQKTSN
jgi:septal ring-binding cell division protein DamX